MKQLISAIILPALSQADIRNPLRYLLIKARCLFPVASAKYILLRQFEYISS